MAERSPTAQKVMDAAAAMIAELGLELVDVELVREGQARILRLIIDKPGGVDHEDCSRVSRLVDPVIDGQLNLHGHDYLEVSSPGLERPLKNESDLIRHRGEWVEVALYQALEGRKKFEGRLGDCAGGIIRLEDENGQLLRQFTREEVAKVKRIVRFD
jgi:ribosome maturation factor RimP